MSPPAEPYGDPIYDCPPDLDDNRVVDVLDLLELLSAWGPCLPDHYCSADLDHTGEVDVLDLLEIIRQWGPCL